MILYPEFYKFQVYSSFHNLGSLWAEFWWSNQEPGILPAPCPRAYHYALMNKHFIITEISKLQKPL